MTRAFLRPLVAGAAVAVVAAWLGTPLGSGQQYQTIGPANCTNANCHATEASWWQGDPHFRTADGYLSGGAKFSRLAQSYGIDPDDAAAVNAKCFNCHGTVISGAETDEIEYGVSCESCHGPGSGYKDPHQENYAAGVQAGMLDSRNVSARAAMCMDCHLITEQKLLAVHPQGWIYPEDYTSGMKGVSGHWKEFTGADKDPAPFAKLLGGVQEYVVATPPARTGGGGNGGGGTIVRVRTDTVYVQVGGPGGGPGGIWLYQMPGAVRPISLGPRAALRDSSSVFELLSAFQRRVAGAYTALDSTYRN